MYTDDVHLTAANVMGVLYASRKFIITNLTKQCLKFVEDNLSAETALPLLQQSMLLDDTDLKKKVLAEIEDEAPAILSSEDFMKLSEQALHEVLQLELRIDKELDVFKAAVKWAQTKCQELQKSIEGSSLREVLGENLFLIRFPTMTADDINEAVVPSDVLTDSEGFKVLQYITAKSKKPENLPFSTEPRGTKLAQLLVAQVNIAPRRLLASGPYTAVNGSFNYYDNIHHKNTTLICRVSKPLNLKRLFIHAGNVQRMDHTLYVKLTQDGQTLLHYNGKHMVTAASGSMSAHFAVDANNVHVKPSKVQLEIKRSLQATSCGGVYYSLTVSPPTTSKLSDDYVSIDFTPVPENFLLGIEYSTVV